MVNLWTLHLLFCGLTSFKLTLTQVVPEESATISRVAGTQARLPCNYKLENPEDLTYIVWKKGEDVEETILWYDAQTKKHQPLKTNVHFLPLESPPFLLIQNVTSKDGGKYSCAVYAYKNPERHYPVHLRVIIPPESVEIFNSAGTPISIVTIPPIREFDSITLICRVTGGDPAPEVIWFKGSQSLLGVPKPRNDNVVESILKLENVTREDFRSEITCQGRNTELTIPTSKKIALDVHYIPRKVVIVRENLLPLVAGKKHKIRCIASDGHPAPEVTWWLNKRQFHIPESDITRSEESTVSTLTFEPTRKDENKTLSCLAKSPSFVHQPIKDQLSLSINYRPKVYIAYNNASLQVKESDPFTMRCVVDAKPAAYNISWYHKKYPIKEDPNKGIIIKDDSLFMKRVTYQMLGTYSCIVYNEVGNGTSKPIFLDVQYAPVCRNKDIEIVGAGRSEQINVECRVKSSPVVQKFRWEFINEKTSRDIAQGKFTSEEKLSTLEYKPIQDPDFGLLRCWGSNSMGEQRAPCVFKVVEAGLPGKPENCTAVNETYSEITITCDAGYNGGLDQHFRIEVFDMLRTIHVMNFSETSSRFRLTKLEPDTSFLLTIYAVNSKGKSEAHLLQSKTSSDPELDFEGHPRTTYVFPVTTIIGVLIGVVAALVFVSIVIVIVMKLRSTNGKKKASPAHAPLRPDVENDAPETVNDSEGGEPRSSNSKKLRHANVYETAGYQPAPTREDKSTQEKEGEVEYTELEFRGGKVKSTNKKNKGKSKGKKKFHSPYDPTIYASIDITRTEKQNLQNKEKNKKHKKKEEKAKKVAYEPLLEEPKTYGRREPPVVEVNDETLPSAPCPETPPSTLESKEANAKENTDSLSRMSTGKPTNLDENSLDATQDMNGVLCDMQTIDQPPICQEEDSEVKIETKPEEALESSL